VTGLVVLNNLLGSNFVLSIITYEGVKMIQDKVRNDKSKIGFSPQSTDQT